MAHPRGEVLCYWEQQGADKLCAVHCLNALLQGPVFNEGQLGGIAQELDEEERRLMGLDANAESNNVDATGNFSIGVIERALANYGGIQCVNIDRADVKQQVLAQPQDEQGFICNSHAREHWYTIRQVNGSWWDLDSLKPAPRQISEFNLAVTLGAAMTEGFTIFAIRGWQGNLPMPRANGQLRPNQYLLDMAGIQELERQGRQKEADEMAAAQRAAGGDGFAGGAAGEEEGGPAFTKIAPASQRQEKTDWNKLSGGQRLDGSAAQSGGAAQAEDMDDELRQALAASLADEATRLPPPPEEPEAGAASVCTIQVRCPGGTQTTRRFLVEEMTLGQAAAWLEWASASDAALKLPALSAASYSLLKKGFPKSDKFSRAIDGIITQNGGDEDVRPKTLKDCGFATGRELLTLQL